MIANLIVAALGLFSSVNATPLHDGPLTPATLFPRSSCSASIPASCQNTTAQTNLCCFEAPGGQILQVQFWDTNPVTGPSNSWTIHGLWRDGTYSENCDSSRNYPSITSVLQNNGKQDLINFMNEFWISDDESNEAFWEHEWDTHGTCYTTINPSCLPSGSTTGADAAAFFQRAVDMFVSLPTYTFLSKAGITPGTKTYTYSALSAAIQQQYGYTPSLDCSGSVIDSISYYFNLQGSLVDGTMIPIAAPTKGSCPSSGISYPTKSGASPATSVSLNPTSTTSTARTTTTSAPGSKSTGSTTTTTTSSGPTGTSATPPPKSTVTALTSSGSAVGCFLSAGTWSTQTCATFTATTSGSGFTLTSSKGACAVSGTTFSCSSSNSATIFTAVSSGSNILLAYGGSTAFSANSVPSGTTQVTVYAGSSGSQALTFVFNAT